MLVKRILIFLSLITILFASAQVSLAQEPDYDRVNQIAKNMNCPTCVGVNLADCRTQTCEQWRGQIQDLIAQGYSDQEVLDYFANQYGVQVLLEPPKEGSTLILWVLPVAALLIGGGWLFYILRRWKKPVQAAPVGAAAALPSDDYLKQVEKDLEAH
jgi:cytochrome c-type biogenesis protein CcmH